jgi:glycosyltransferase involved in cell wall biosynthesis
VRLLLVNWLDRENPQSGGAEIHLHEIFGRLSATHDIALLCSGWNGCERRVRLDGIDVHRVGTRYTFPLLAWRYFRKHLSSWNADVLLEDINKIPLYTPLWRPRHAAALVPHLFGGTAFREVPIPIASAVWLAERPLVPVYRRIPFQAISQSTADDLVDRGIPREQIRVIYPGIDTSAFTPAPEARSTTPLFVYLGRLKRYKGVDIVLRAFARVMDRSARLEIAGTGDYRDELERLAASLDLGERVRFLGFIDEDAKRRLLREAWALAFASPKEGWGITNFEAAASGTPVIASNSPGLRESVVDGRTGFLVEHDDVNAMAAAMSRIASSASLVAALGQEARRFVEQFSWEEAARRTEAHLQEIAELED